jgi:hypothetical protein
VTQILGKTRKCSNFPGRRHLRWTSVPCVRGTRIRRIPASIRSSPSRTVLSRTRDVQVRRRADRPRLLLPPRTQHRLKPRCRNLVWCAARPSGRRAPRIAQRRVYLLCLRLLYPPQRLLRPLRRLWLHLRLCIKPFRRKQTRPNTTPHTRPPPSRSRPRCRCPSLCPTLLLRLLSRPPRLQQPSPLLYRQHP